MFSHKHCLLASIPSPPPHSAVFSPFSSSPSCGILSQCLQVSRSNSFCTLGRLHPMRTQRPLLQGSARPNETQLRFVVLFVVSHIVLFNVSPGRQDPWGHCPCLTHHLNRVVPSPGPATQSMHRNACQSISVAHPTPSASDQPLGCK